MRISKSILLLTTIALAVGCKKTIIESGLEPTAARFSLVTAKTTPQKSRATLSEDFLPSSMIGVFASEAQVVDLSVATNSNVGYANQSGNSIWSESLAEQAIFFLADDAPMNFYGYHPFSGQTAAPVTVSDKMLTYTLTSDQSSAENLKNADLLWGSALNCKQSGGTIKMEFAHKLAKVTLNITKGVDWGSTEVQLNQVDISSKDMLSSATLDLASGVIVPVADKIMPNGVKSTITPARVLSSSNAYVCDFIFIPSSIKGLKFNFSIGNGLTNYSATVSSVIELASGTQTNINVVINSLSAPYLSIESEILSWNFVCQVDIDGI